MSEDPQGKPPSPFALTPSAKPPPVSGRPAPVVVPPASRSPSVATAGSPAPTVAVVTPTTPSDENAIDPTPVTSRRGRSPIAVLTGGAAVVLLAAVGAWTLRARLRSGHPAVRADTVAAPSAASPVASSANP